MCTVFLNAENMYAMFYTTIKVQQLRKLSDLVYTVAMTLILIDAIE